MAVVGGLYQGSRLPSFVLSDREKTPSEALQIVPRLPLFIGEHPQEVLSGMEMVSSTLVIHT